MLVVAILSFAKCGSAYAQATPKALRGSSLFVSTSDGFPAVKNRRLPKPSFLATRQHGFHGFKNCVTIELFHALNVIGTSIAPMDNWGSVMTKQARDITKQANGLGVRWQY
jgi:hypothetical protein